MTISKQIAGLIGPTMITLALSEELNAHIWATVTSSQTYIVGALWFIVGLSIIRAHNHWIRGWPIVVTFFGWYFLLDGLGKMFFPERITEIHQLHFSKSTTILVVFMYLTIGIFLTFKAYSREYDKKRKDTENEYPQKNSGF